LLGLSKQTILPQEVIIIDSSSNNDVYDIACGWETKLPVLYQKFDFAYPGKARNIGVQMAKGEWFGFLDSKTVPKPEWLEKSLARVKETNCELVVGLTIFAVGQTPYQEVLRAASYGCIAHETLPGSIIHKNAFDKCGAFISDIRSAEDMEWMSRAKAVGIRQTTLGYPSIIYSGLPESFGATIRKYFMYSRSTARVDILLGHKKIYLSIFMILLTLLVTKWNYIITIYGFSPILYAPNITKIYLGILVSLYIVFRGFVLPAKLGVELRLFERTYLLALFLLVSGLIYNWNVIFAHWDMNNYLYVPHITKIYLGSLVIGAFLFRGVVRPLKRNISPSYLFPWRWITVGFVGLILDVVKAPGYLWGAIVEIVGRPIRVRFPPEAK